jgi:hypothetical protein
MDHMAAGGVTVKSTVFSVFSVVRMIHMAAGGVTITLAVFSVFSVVSNESQNTPKLVQRIAAGGFKKNILLQF